MNFLKKWVQDWAIFDLFALTVGIGGTIFFVNFKNSSILKDSAWYDIWANLSIDIIGVWLSVRIIGFLISRNTRRNENRTALISQLEYLSQRIDEIPFYNKYSKIEIEKEIIRINFMVKQNATFFYYDEKLLVDQINKSLPELFELFQKGLVLFKHQQMFYLKYREKQVKLEQKRKEVLAKHDIAQKQFKNGNITTRQYAQQTNKLINSPVFTSSEKKNIKEYIYQILSDKKQKQDFQNFPVNNYFQNDITTSSSYQKFHNKIEKLRLVRSVNYDLYIQDFNKFKTKSPEFQLPSELRKIYLLHLYSLRELIENRKKIDYKVRRITDTISKLIKNIKEEPELDLPSPPQRR